MTRQELKLKKKELETELHQIETKLYNFEYEEKKSKYGDKFTCEFCKYNAVNDCSCDGWHNTCGAENCTCCHSVCEKYEPDNYVTLFIKQNIRTNYGTFRSDNTNGHGYISEREYKAIKSLCGNIFKPLTASKKMIELLKVIFDIKEAEQND